MKRALKGRELFLLYLCFEASRQLTFMLSQRNEQGRWRFKDGVCLDVELEAVDLEKIRATCNDECRSQWTAIASRERLYQFIAMSDDDTQLVMRNKLLTIVGKEDVGLTSSAGGGFSNVGTSDNFARPRTTKR